MKVVLTLILLVLGNDVLAGEYVLSFDDAPRDDAYLSGNSRTEKLLEKLRQSRVNEAVFYCNPRNDLDDREARARLAAYSAAGHILANHTTDHPSPETLSAEEYMKRIDRADALLSVFPTYRRWFRYPFLREAIQDQQKHAAIKRHLSKNGYQQGYVTVEIYDWHIDQRLALTKVTKEEVDFGQLRKLYLKVITESVLFYDALAKNILKRSPVHVILLHENDVNALFIGDVVKALQSEGFYPTEASRAFTDPIADPKWDTYPYSMRRISMIAEKLGYQGPRFPRWTSTAALDELMAEYKVFGRACGSELLQRRPPE